MAFKHRILIQTDPTWISTGLAENARTLLAYLMKTGKYEVACYCQQGIVVNNPNLELTPWKSYGCIPYNQELVNKINQDPARVRNASYGALRIDEVIKEFKPTIWIGSNDIWAYPRSDYAAKSWFKKIHSIFHITVDSLPVSKEAFEQAASTKLFFTWAKFAADEMKKKGGADFAHVDHIYGAMNCDDFTPVPEIDREGLRRASGLGMDTKVFLFVFRNQPRKQAVRVLEAFAKLKQQDPSANVKLHFHTSFSLKASGWDIPAMMQHYGIRQEDVLSTYVCKKCRSWRIHPFIGENKDCTHCGAKKSCDTATITQSVPAHEMKYLYGHADGVINAMSSGGLELNCVQALLCGKPLAVTNYSCGEDYCLPETSEFVTPLGYHPYDEHGTNFIKAATDVDDITNFMKKVMAMSPEQTEEIGEKARKWAYDKFSVETVGKKWEALFDSLPAVDWNTIQLDDALQLRNEKFPFPSEVVDNAAFISLLYKEVLKIDEPVSGEGFQHWMARLEHGVTRENVYKFFIEVAKKENEEILLKQSEKEKKPETKDFSPADENGKKRLLLIMKQSVGDIYMISSLLRSISETYPNHNIYFATEERYSKILTGHPLIYKQIAYQPEMEDELKAIGHGNTKGFFDVYLHPGIPTQRQRCYLSKAEPVYSDLNYQD